MLDQAVLTLNNIPEDPFQYPIKDLLRSAADLLCLHPEVRYAYV